MLDERQVAILKLRNSGNSYKEISRTFGISQTRVGQILRKAEALIDQCNQEKKWTFGLSKKTENLLISAGYENKKCVIEAAPTGKLTKISGLGQKSIEEIKLWAGLS